MSNYYMQVFEAPYPLEKDVNTLQHLNGGWYINSRGVKLLQ